MRNLVLVVGLTAACSSGESAAPPKAPVHDGSARVAAAPLDAGATALPGMVLGRLPTTSSYRVIACTLGPLQRDTCERMLDRLVGSEVRGQHGELIKVTKIGSVKSSRNDNVATVELAAPTGTAVASGSAVVFHRSVTLTDTETKLLRKHVRAISPRPKWATGERFAVSALEADVDGDHHVDRVAVGTIVDFRKDSERMVVGIAVWLANKPLEIVNMDTNDVQLVGTVDLDGDGGEEVLIERTFQPSAIDYWFELRQVVPGKPLALDLDKPGALAEGWKLYDLLQERDDADK